MIQQNYFTWRRSLGEIAEEMYGVPAEEINTLDSNVVQKQYFKDELSPEEAAELLFHEQDKEK